MGEDELVAILAREKRAGEMVAALCAPRLTDGAREWRVSIPARPDHDPDLVIGAALADVGPLVGEVNRLRAVEAAVRHLGRCWEQLCRCVDEFEPGDMAACAEWRDALDGAVEATLAALGA